MVLLVRCVLERSEGNPSLRGGLVELCSRGELGVHSKSYNVPHRLGMGRLISIQA